MTRRLRLVICETLRAEALRGARRDVADRAAILDLLHVIAGKHTEADTIEAVFDVLTMLFAPAKLGFLPVRDGRPGPLTCRPAALDRETSALARLTPGGEPSQKEDPLGFVIPVAHGGERTGWLEVGGLAFPKHRGRYRELATLVADVLSLALGGVRLVADLQDALARVRTLSGLLPICASCKRIRDDSGYWQQVEKYITERSEAAFSHGICPECVRKLYPDLADEVIAGGT